MMDEGGQYRKPEHVPDALFIPGNIWENMDELPHVRMRRLTAGRDIVYLQNHHHKGHSPAGTWLAASAEANRQIMMDTDTFPTKGATVFSKLLGGLSFFPVETSPPEHSDYRAILAPFFKPATINALVSSISRRVDELLDRVIPNGGCEFVSEFARPLPASIFLDQMGLPQERARDFLVWARTVMSQESSVDHKVETLHQIRDYLAEKLTDAKGGAAKGTLLEALAIGQVDGRSLTMEESLGGSMVVFLGGLDTVANLLGWVFFFLATNPEQQAELRNHPERLSSSLEELLRFFSPVTVSRIAATDINVMGAPIRAGDTVCCSLTLASRDDHEFANPDKLDLSQPARRHLAFGYGPHTCIGMHLARAEVKIAVERWFARTESFRLVPGAKVPMRGAVVSGVDALPLVIDLPASSRNGAI